MLLNLLEDQRWRIYSIQISAWIITQNWLFSLCMDLWTSYLIKLFIRFVPRHENWWQVCWDLRKFSTTSLCIWLLASHDSFHLLLHFMTALEIKKINSTNSSGLTQENILFALLSLIFCDARQQENHVIFELLHIRATELTLFYCHQEQNPYSWTFASHKAGYMIAAYLLYKITFKINEKREKGGAWENSVLYLLVLMWPIWFTVRHSQTENKFKKKLRWPNGEELCCWHLRESNRVQKNM